MKGGFQGINFCSFSFVKARQEIRHSTLLYCVCVLCEKRLLSGAIWINCMCDHFLARGGASHITRARYTQHLCDERVTSLWRAQCARVSTDLHWPLENAHRGFQCLGRERVIWQRLDDNILTKIISVLTLNVFNSWWYSLLVHNACKEVLEEFCHFILLLLEDKMHQNNISFEDLLEIY